MPHQVPAPATTAGHPPDAKGKVAAAAISTIVTQQHVGAEQQNQEGDKDGGLGGAIEGHVPTCNADASVPPPPPTTTPAPPPPSTTNQHVAPPVPLPPTAPKNDTIALHQPVNSVGIPSELSTRAGADTAGTIAKDSGASVPITAPVGAVQHITPALPTAAATTTAPAPVAVAVAGPSDATIGKQPGDAATLPSADALPTKPATATATASIFTEAGEKTLPNGVAAAAAYSGPTDITGSSTAKRKFDQIGTDLSAVETPALAAKRTSDPATATITTTTATAVATASATSIAPTVANPAASTGPSANPAARIKRTIQLVRPLSEMPRRKKPRPANQHQCGYCDYCMVDECGTCKACLDMTRFGGANVRRQKCVSRPLCPNRPPPSPRKRKPKKTPAPAPLPAALPPLPAGAPPMTMKTKPHQATPGSSDKCQNCMAEDCGSCLHCLNKCPKQIATPPTKSHAADIVLQGVPPDRFNMSEILSFPVVFSYHVPTASRKAPVVPIAQTLTIASEVVEALDKNQLAGPPDPSTNDTNGDDGAGLNVPPDVVEIDASVDKEGEPAKVDTASSAKESNSTAKDDGESMSADLVVAESFGPTEKEGEARKVDVAGTNASSPERSDAEAKNKEEEPTKSETEAVTLRPVISEEEAEASQMEAERQQKQWDRLMKSSIARFERRRAGGKNYSRIPSNTNRSQSESKPSNDNEHAAEGTRRSRRNRTRSRRSLERENDGDDDDEDYSEGEKDSVAQENYASTTSEPAKDLPSGWILEKVARSCGIRKDRFWYSPILQKKFRSRVDVDRFLAKMEIAKDRLGTAKPRDSPSAKSKNEEKVAAESSEVFEVCKVRLPTEKCAQKEDSKVANDSNSNEDQAKLEELAWTLLLEDRTRGKARRRYG